MTLVNGINNPCCYCGRALKDEENLFIKCIELPSKPHGNNCDCYLAIGGTCLMKIQKEKLK
jgi:hypothetical protein